MVKIALSAALLAFLLTGVPDDGLAFRCGSGLVIAGDRTGKVLIECGPPTSKEVAGSKKERKSKPTDRTRKTWSSSESASHREDSGRVERWFYNCGEHDFVYLLTFEGGVLTKEETKGYGKGNSDCQGRR